MKKIYAIRDRIAQDLAGHYPLVVFRTDGQAVRYFADSMAVENGAINKHPQDYELIVCGEINDDGQIHAYAVTGIIITGDALISAQTEHTPELKVG